MNKLLLLSLSLTIVSLTGCESMGGKSKGVTTVQDLVEINTKMAEEYCGVYKGKVNISFTEDETKSSTSIDCTEKKAPL